MRLIRNNVERIAESAAQIARLKAEGFKEMEPAITTGEKESKGLHEMNTQELRELANKLGIEGCSGLKKAELLEVLKDVV